MRDKVDYNKLIYDFKGLTLPIYFAKFEGPIYIYDNIKYGKTTLQQVEKQQKDFKNELNEIKSGNSKYQSDSQLYVIRNVEYLYNLRQKIIDLLNDNSKIRSEAIYKSKQNETGRKGLKILTPKQMLQRLPISLAQVKAGNNSERLLNENREIVYSSYQSKQITKKVCNNIIKFIQ